MSALTTATTHDAIAIALNAFKAMPSASSTDDAEDGGGAEDWTPISVVGLGTGMGTGGGGGEGCCGSGAVDVPEAEGGAPMALGGG
jgi:hypothetical protein